ncbi:MAG: ATP-binding protein [Hyphomicrobium sp.]|jgi:hypothetical protein
MSEDRFSLTQKPPGTKPLPRLVIYGEPGVGKSTFGAAAPGAIVVPTEDGTLGLSVARIPNEGKCESWGELMFALKALRDREHAHKWVILDTFNNAEHLCAAMVCERDFSGVWNSAKGKEGYNAYGKGDKATAEEFRELLNLLDVLQQKKNMGVILLGHIGLHKQGNAMGSDFQKFGGDCGKATWNIICGWADQVAHAGREMRVSAKEGEKAKASAIGSERWLTFEGGPARDAKSRAGYEMPEKILLSWDEYAAHLGGEGRCAELIEQALGLIAAAAPSPRGVIEKTLGGPATAENLGKLAKNRLENLIGYLMAAEEKEKA